MKWLAHVFVMLAAASPAAAQHRSASGVTPVAAARLLENPEAQDLVAQQIVALASTVLDTKVGPLAGLANAPDHIRSGDTLHSVVRERDPNYDRHLYERSRAAAATAGTVAAAAVEETAALRETAARLRARLKPLLETAKAFEADQ